MSVFYHAALSSTSSGRRELLSSAQRAQLLSLPISLGELEKFYTLTPADLDFIAGHRTDSNRLGIAVQLCFLRYPGRAWTPEEGLPAALLRGIAEQVGADSCALQSYAERDQTRGEHFLELLNEYGWRSFGFTGHVLRCVICCAFASVQARPRAPSPDGESAPIWLSESSKGPQLRSTGNFNLELVIAPDLGKNQAVATIPEWWLA